MNESESGTKDKINFEHSKCKADEKHYIDPPPNTLSKNSEYINCQVNKNPMRCGRMSATPDSLAPPIPPRSVKVPMDTAPKIPVRPKSVILKGRERKTDEASDYEDMQYVDLFDEDAVYANTNVLRIVMVGKTGCGKSATGNSILGKQVFESKVSGRSVTQECQLGVSEVDGCEVHVVDTPGLFDTKLSSDEINKEIIKCVQMTFPGPNIFLLILQITRITTEEIETFKQIFGIFGEHMKQFSLILFTRLDELKPENKSLETYIEETGPTLKRLITSCNGRYFGIDNRAPDDVRSNDVNRLIQIFNNIVKENRCKYFSNDWYVDTNIVMNGTNYKETKKTSQRSESDDEKLQTDIDRQIAALEIKALTLDGGRSTQISQQQHQIEKRKSKDCTFFGSFQTDTAKSNLSTDFKYETSGKESFDLGFKEKELCQSLAQIEEQRLEMELKRKVLLEEIEKLKATRQEMIVKNIGDIMTTTVDECQKSYETILSDLTITSTRITEVRKQLKDGKNKTDAGLQKQLAEEEENLLKEKERLTRLKTQTESIRNLLNKSSRIQQKLGRQENKCQIM